jgi:hypothetical protein
MLLGIVLLYVGAVLAVNGIWLIGTARAAELRARFSVEEPAAATERAAAAARAAGEPTREARRAAAAEAAIMEHPTFINGREVAVLNVFTGLIGFAVAVTLLVQGNENEDLGFIASSGFILLFAFTYLWVAANQFLNAGGRALGWYSLFVAVTAVPTAFYTFDDAGGNAATIWLGIDWLAWAVLWFMFFVLLALERPIARITGYVAVLEGIGTAWVLGYLLLQGSLEF